MTSANIQIHVDLILPQNVVPLAAQKHHANLWIESWEVAMHWLIRLEIDSNHKIPHPRKIVSALKARGEFLHRLYLLCKECHPLLHKSYSHYWELFRLASEEWIIGGCHEIIYPPIATTGWDKKEAYLKPLHTQVSMAKRLENPFSNTDMRVNKRLLDAAIKLAETSNQFRKKHYAPFTKAWRGYVISLDSPDFRRYFIEGEKLYRQGAGKAKFRVL